jgi:hypothetical protein
MYSNDRATPMEIARITPPVTNTINAEAVQHLMGRLYRAAGSDTFSLEICQEELSTYLLIAAPHKVMPSLLAHIRQTWPQAQVQILEPEQDPARPRKLGEYPITGKLKLTERSELPLQTSDDFEIVDTMQGLMALAGTLKPGERVLSQLLLRPAPNPWSGLARARSDQVRLITANGRLALLTFMSVCLFSAGLMFSLGVPDVLMHHLVGVLWIAAGAILGVGSLWLTYALWGVFRPLDADLVMSKVQQVGFQFSLRLGAFAEDSRRASELLDVLRSGYGQFDLAGSNSFVMYYRRLDLLSRRIEDSLSRSIWMWQPLGILVPSEVASLWHLPLQITPAMHMGPGLYRRLVPPKVLTAGGHLIGTYEHQGRELPVHLSGEAMSSHILVLGKAQRGKSAFLQRLASCALSDRNRALVVIDPHADLARAIAGTEAAHDSGRLIYWDLNNTYQPIGFNLLEPSNIRSDDRIISDTVDIMSRIWRENWGPRMEDAYRWAARCLIAASRLGGYTYTLLDVNRLLSDGAFRRLILHQLDDTDAMRFFEYEFDQVSSNFRDEIIRPVQSKINRFISNELVRGIFGQAHSGLDLQEVLDRRSVLLISTHKGSIGADAAGLIGSVILGQLRALIAGRDTQSRSDRAPVTIMVDELQTLVAPTFEGTLSELCKFGANLILATQTLSLLDTFDPALRPIVLSNQSTLITFETASDDAHDLLPEFDDAITTADLVNLPRYTAYAKTFAAGQRTPVFSFTTLPPIPSDDSWAALMAKITHERFGRLRSVIEDGWRAREFCIQQDIARMMQTSVHQPQPSGNGRTKDASGRRSRPGVGAGPNSVE